MGPRRRTARYLLVAGAALLLVVALVPASWAQEADTDRPAVFKGDGSARAVIWFADRSAGLTPIPESFHGEFPEASATWDSSGESTARASVLYPGNAVITGPGLACGAIGPNFPPEFQPVFAPCAAAKYPLSVRADSTQPDVATVGSAQLGREGDVLYGRAGAGQAHVADDGVKAVGTLGQTTIAGLSSGDGSGGGSPDAPPSNSGPLPVPVPGAGLPGADPALLSFRSISATTDQHFDGPVLVVTSEARVNGVSLAAGLVTIDSVVTRSVSRTVGDKPAATNAESVLQGVRALGQPATITQEGIAIGSPEGTGGTKALNDSLHQALESAGLTIKLIGASNTAEGNDTSGDAQGVLITANQDLSQVPSQGDTYFATFLLGSVGSSAFADPASIGAAGDELGDGGLTSDFGPAGDLGSTGDLGGGTGSVDASAPALADGSSGRTGGRSSTGAGGDEVALAPGTKRAGLLGGVAANRMKLLYLAFTLTALGLCLAPKATLPSRLPRGGR